MHSNADELLPAAMVFNRYHVSQMTVWRWLRSATLNFPRPLLINRRRYWRLADLIAWERSQEVTT